MKSTVELYNLALSFLGGEQLSTVQSEYEGSALGRLCMNNFPHVLELAMNAYDWSFAKRRAQLAEKPGDMLHPDYTRRYALPADCLKPVRLEGYEGLNDPTHYIIEGRELLTNAAPAVLHYVSDGNDPVLWTPDFAQALARGLAAVLASAKVNDRNMQAQQMELYTLALTDAKVSDTARQRPDRPQSGWMAARHGREVR